MSATRARKRRRAEAYTALWDVAFNLDAQKPK